MNDLALNLEKMRLLDGDQIDGLRHSYPELDFVFDELEKVWDQLDAALWELDQANDRINDLEGDT